MLQCVFLGEVSEVEIRHIIELSKNKISADNDGIDC